MGDLVTMFQNNQFGKGLILALGVCWLLSFDAASAETPQYDMVRIPAGTFLMGSPEDVILRRADEQLHKVHLTRDFFMGRHEVTQEFYEDIMGANPSYNSVCPQCPVESISWREAVVFCNVVSRKAGLAPAYQISGTSVTMDLDSPGYRLPTEAEWEYACRAGTNTIFPYGNCLSSSQANFNAYLPQPGCDSGLYRAQSIPVGSFPPNGWGLYDMVGNINEYCWDWHAPFTAEEQTDPLGVEGSGYHVLRGGAFSIFGPRCQSGSRHPMKPQMALDFMGLRLVRTVVVTPKDAHE